MQQCARSCAALLCFITIAVASPAGGQKDYLTPDPASPSATVNGGTQQDVKIKYSVTDGGGAGTVYPVTVSFGIDAAQSTAAGVIISHTVSQAMQAGNECVLDDSTSCEVTVRVTAPPADSRTDQTYSVFVKNIKNQSGTNGRQFRDVPDVEIRITVPKVDPDPIGTVVTLKNACGVLNGDAVILEAQLTTTAGEPLQGLPLKFFVGSTFQEPAMITDYEGKARTSVSIADLAVGDVPISAVFDGQAPYTGTSGGAQLGINYLFQGFMPPVNADGTSIFKTGRVIPFKIRILDGKANGLIATARPEIGMAKQSTGTAGSSLETPITGTPDQGFVMRYTGTSDDQYIYNWDLTSLENGTYRVMIDLNDSLTCGGWRPTIHETVITVEKKK